MKSILSFLAGLIVFYSTSYTPVGVPPTDIELIPPDTEEIIQTEASGSQMNTEIHGDNFTDSLYNLMPKDKNYMYSPLSVKSALAMAANGADGSTKSEILAVTGIEDLDEFNKEMKSTIEKYTATDLLRLDISNSVWINTDNADYDFSRSFTDTISEYYKGESGKVTNQNAVSTINGWVNNKTNGKIPTIINSTDFDSALINAIYFKAKWDDEFSDINTKPDIFTDRNGKETEIDFMNDTRRIPYAEKDGVKVIELDYMTRSSNTSPDGEEIKQIRLDNTSVSMFILLSDNEIKEPEKIVSSLRDSYSMEDRKVKLSLPKFKIEYSAEISPALKALGINSAFADADFGKMFDRKTNTSISNVLHKTYIEVDEEGTEAAAVTAIIMMGAATPRPEEIIEFKADKPFTFLIRDNISGETLFIGEYAFAE